MWPSLMMAILSTLCPPIGFMGSIVRYVVSEEPGAGVRFLVDIVGLTLPGGVVKELVLDAAADMFLGSELAEATRKVTPYNEVIVRCNRCGRTTHYYVLKDGWILCSNCATDEMRVWAKENDRVYVLRNGVYRIKNELRLANQLQGRSLHHKRLVGRELHGRKLKGTRM